jgi:ABC-type phosphate/phosphonate transport system permease subunit
VDSVPGPAGRAQSLAFGLVPQILPTMALQTSIDALRWSRVSVILLAILGTVVFADLVSARIRRGLG